MNLIKGKHRSTAVALLVAVAWLTTRHALATSNQWFLEQTLLPHPAENNAQFGFAVHSNGSELAIGAPFADANGLVDSGRVEIWRRPAGAWAISETVVSDATALAGAYSGSAVAIDGGHLYIGSPSWDQSDVNRGAVELFHYVSDGWHSFSGMYGNEGDRTGAAIAYDNGLTAIGRPGPCTALCGVNERGGRVFVAYDGDDASAYVEIVADPGTAGDGFGVSVAVYQSADPAQPDLLVVGAPIRHVEGAGDLAGAVYVYANATHVRSGWQAVAYLTAASAAEGDFFGNSVAVGPNRIVVGAPFRDRVVPSPVNNSGAVFVFTPDGSGGWQQESELFLGEAGVNELFGETVAYDPVHDRVFGAAPQRFDSVFGGSGATGSTTVFKRTLLVFPHFGWLATAELTSDDQQSIGQQAGRALSVSGDRVFVGAPDYDANPNNGVVGTGRVLVFAADEIFGDGFN